MVDDVDGDMDRFMAWGVESDGHDVVARGAQLARDLLATRGDTNAGPLGTQLHESIGQGEIDVEGPIAGRGVVAWGRANDGDRIMADDDVAEPRLPDDREVRTHGHHRSRVPHARRGGDGDRSPPFGEIDDRPDDGRLFLSLPLEPSLTST